MSTYWCNSLDVRMAAGLSTVPTDPDYISDVDINYYIGKASEVVIEDVFIRERSKDLSGKIDGSNTIYFTPNHPIVDTSYDGTVTAADVIVYAWGDRDSLDTRVAQSVSSVNDYEGRIVLASAPSSTFEALTADYYYSLSEINYSLLGQATAHLAGYLAITNKWLLIPESYTTGAARFRHTKPYNHLLNSYYDLLRRIKSQPFVKKKHSKITILRQSRGM